MLSGTNQPANLMVQGKTAGADLLPVHFYYSTFHLTRSKTFTTGVSLA